MGESALAVVLRREEQGPVLAAELVSERDLVDARAELWFEAFLRRGVLDVPLESVRAAPRPLHHRPQGGEPMCVGFSLAANSPAGDEIRCVFTRGSLEPAAARLARRLVAEGVLPEGATYYYGLRAQPPAADEAPRRQVPAGVVVRPDAAQPLAVHRAPLAPLLARAEERQAEFGVADDYPVFFTREALAKAESAARKGAACQPPVETGALFVGCLCSCPETGELYAVVLDVLEATHSEGTTYSLTYSGRTWARIQTVMRARQSHPSMRSHRLLGQVHGHSFLPLEGAEPCEACAALAVCTRTTAFLSAEDRAWCRAVFHREPWQLSQVFGLNARGEGVEAFYGQRGGRLVRRSYFVLESFES